jgi:hypothetical protein
MTSDRQCDVMGTRRLNLNTAVLNLNMTRRRPTSGGGGPPHQDPAAPTKHRVWRERPMDEVITICTSQNCTPKTLPNGYGLSLPPPGPPDAGPLIGTPAACDASHRRGRRLRL